jgi:hypothetical protein
MNKIILAAAGTIVVASLGACGSSEPKSAPPPSPSALADKIPGCAQLIVNTPTVNSLQDVTCILTDGAQVELATFASQADETQWIQNGGPGSPPDPTYAGCCIEGNHWAATVGFNNNQGPTDVDYNAVIAAIGGRQVNG